MLTVTKESFKDEVVMHQGLVVIDFYADWCGPCKMLSPVLDELEGTYPDVKFCKVNVDSDPELAREFNVQSIPFVAFVKEDTFLDMSVGFVPKENLEKLIEENR